MRPHTHLFFTVILAFFLVSCGSTPVKTSNNETLDLALEEIASYLEEGEELGLDENYKRKLLATELLIRKNEIDRAHSIINQVPTEYGEPQFFIRQMHARGQITIREGEPYLAQRYLFHPKITGELVKSEPEHGSLLLDLGATLLFDLGDYLRSVDQRVMLGTLLSEDELRKQLNHDLIWEALAELPTAELFDLAKTEKDPVKQGWYSLAALSKSNGANYRKQLDDISNWQQVWPSHPANDALPADLQLVMQLADQQSIRIAVMLPLTGKLSSAGQAIREGFISAYYDDAANASALPSISFYDTVNQDINQLFDQALAEGAQLIVGPLLKKNLEIIASRESLAVPVLALNSLEKTTETPQQQVDTKATPAEIVPAVNMAVAEQDNNLLENPNVSENYNIERNHELLFQFSMAVEHEAKQVAEKAWRDGHRRVLIVAPAGGWGDRSTSAFKQTWLELGGDILDERRYRDQRSYSNLIESSVAVNQSKDRKVRLQSMLGTKLEFEPRSRRDIDFIFLPSYSHQAKQLKPLLAFHYAGDIPVYSMNQVYAGTNTRNLSDLNGIRFSTLPWYFEKENNERRAIDAYGDNNPSFQPFYAMGVDAYHIYPRLEQLKLIDQANFYGYTGKLSVGEGNRIQREQSWAEIRKGAAIEIKNEPLLEASIVE